MLYLFTPIIKTHQCSLIFSMFITAANSSKIYIYISRKDAVLKKKKSWNLSFVNFVAVLLRKYKLPHRLLSAIQDLKASKYTVSQNMMLQGIIGFIFYNWNKALRRMKHLQEGLRQILTFFQQDISDQIWVLNNSISFVTSCAEE